MITTAPGPKFVHLVYSDRARIGYIVELLSGKFRWELSLLSERAGGFPRGDVDTMDEAVAALSVVFTAWARAAGLAPKERD